MPTQLVLQNHNEPVDTLEVGVEVVERLIVDPELDRVTSKFCNQDVETPANEQAYDDAARTELWLRSLEFVAAEDPFA